MNEVLVPSGWRKPNALDVICEGLQTVGFSLNVIIRCVVLKYIFPGDRRLSFQKCFILNSSRSKDWRYFGS